MIAAADVPAGAVVTDAMLATATVPQTLAESLVRDPAAIRGRVLVVPLQKGEPLGIGMTVAQSVGTAGRRLIRVSLASVDIAPDVTLGADADVVASFAAGAGTAPEVAVVATAGVTSIDESAPQQSGPQDVAASSSVQVQPGGAGTSVTLDCSSADALRILWARDNARVLRLLAHPRGDATPSPVQAPA